MPTCPGCGIKVENNSPTPHPYIGANTGCWEKYGIVLAREYSNPAFFKAHRYTVDAYALQHPGNMDRKAIQSVNVHLASLTLIFEYNLDLDEATKTLGRIIQKHKQAFLFLEPPTHEYKITVLDLIETQDPKAHFERAKEWARSTWKAWRGNVNTIRPYLPNRSIF